MKIFHWITILMLLSTVFGQQTTLEYEILTMWNGTVIDHLDNPARVVFSNNNGLLHIQLSGKFYNSPKLPPALPDPCPQRSVYGLYSYEVIEVFWLNELDEYLELEFSPRGQYFNLILAGYRNQILHSIQLDVSIENNCETEDCTERWVADTDVPMDYLPPNTNRFNAYAIHGKIAGEAEPANENLVYESLFPADPAVLPSPDFHYLDGFGDIDLGTLGIDTSTRSPLWEEVIGDKSFEFNYPFRRQSDCADLIENYDGRVLLKKETHLNLLKVRVEGNDHAGVAPDIPKDLQIPGLTSLLSTDTESIWVNFANEQGEYLRIGMNPYGAYGIESSFIQQIDILQNVKCNIHSHASSWFCTFEFSAVFLPTETFFFQGAHAHCNLLSNPEREMVASICPGFGSGSTGEFVDWNGCQIDVNTLAAY